MERVAGGKAIEQNWRNETGELTDGRAISSSLDNHGNGLALDLYDNSSILVSHVLAGMIIAFELNLQPENSVIACHGGVFNVPGYGERIKRILNENLRFESPMNFTKDFSENACAEGAAIAALV